MSELKPCSFGSDVFNVTESYQWHDDIMEITRAIVRGTDEARLVKISEHFEVDLSEIREWIEEKKKRKFAKPQTNADHIRAMTDENLAKWYGAHACCMADPLVCGEPGGSCRDCWLKWLQRPAEMLD